MPKDLVSSGKSARVTLLPKRDESSARSLAIEATSCVSCWKSFEVIGPLGLLLGGAFAGALVVRFVVEVVVVVVVVDLAIVGRSGISFANLR